MCGLITIIAKQDRYLDNIFGGCFKQMLYVDALRGFDSTGVAKVNYNNEVEVEKDAVPAGTFIARNNSNPVLFTGKALIGHNRAATKGSVIKEFAHPHKVNNITLIHNGTLHSHKYLADVASDSLAIATAFSENDPKEIIPNLSGAFALIWYDSKHKSYHWVRNNQRPLYLIETETSYVLVSELELGIWILTRNKIKILSTKEIEPYDYYSFKHNGEIAIEKLEQKKSDDFTSISMEEKAITDALAKAGIKKNDTVHVQYYWVDNSNSVSEWKRHVGLLEEIPDIEVSSYSNKNLIGAGVIEGKVSHIITYKDDKFPTLFVTLPTEKKNQQTNITTISENTNVGKTYPLRTLNGISFTPEIKKQTEKHGACYACSDHVKQSDIPKSLLVVRQLDVTKPKFDKASGIYYGTENVHKLTYKLYCPKCVSFFSKCDPHWIKRETDIAA